jgi:hypothetical protein
VVEKETPRRAPRLTVRATQGAQIGLSPSALPGVQSEELLRQLLESAPDAIVGVDAAELEKAVAGRTVTRVGSTSNQTDWRTWCVGANDRTGKNSHRR